MEISLLVSRILALTYLSAGIAAFCRKITFSQVVESFERSQGLAFVTGFISLVFGMILVTYHNIWIRNWTVIITIVGWLSLLKGIMLITSPQLIVLLKPCYKNTKTWGIFMIILGVLFGYLGFII